MAGGTKLLKGKLNLSDLTEGTIDRKLLAYRPNAVADAPNNPILSAGDLIRVQDSLIGSLNAVSEFTNPFIGIYTTYSLFKIYLNDRRISSKSKIHVFQFKFQ